MFKAIGLALAGLLFVGTPVAADDVAAVASPSDVLAVELKAEKGVLQYRVTRFGEPVVDWSKLAIALKGAPTLGAGATIAKTATRSEDDTWDLPWGERSRVRNHFNELTATVADKGGRTFDVVFRVYDDGLGFRYDVPKQDALAEALIRDEETEFRFAEPATTWWIEARLPNRYEYIYKTTPLEAVTMAHTPITMRTEDGLHISIHEAALVDYSGMSVRRTKGRAFKADLAPSSEKGVLVRGATPFVTPWRTLMISDTAGGLVESDLVLNLNEPNKLGDVSWVEPGKYVGIWWGMHLGVESWESGPIHGANTKNTMRYIDFAAENGFKGVLVEGWNIGWDGDWVQNGDLFDFTKAYPDYDIEKLAAYALSKGVRLVAHNETSGNIANYEDQMAAAYAMYERLGIRQIKTGYVADAGHIKARGADGKMHLEYHDGQVTQRHHIKVLEEAAKHRLSINSHEPVKDTGLRRTYPNWISREGARGQEYNAWGTPPNPPEHVAVLPFTRMLSGPMDYTPGIFDLTFNYEKTNGNRPQSTLAQQLAHYVVIYSPIQMVADLPENYGKHPDAFRFIKDVVTDWDETKVLNAEIGDYVTIARKAKGSGEWFLGSLTDEEGRMLSVPLSFLTPGTRYRAEIYRDGDKAHWDTAPYDFVREEKTVTSADTLTLRLAAGGGQAIRFLPQP
ncbi:glycoside hydrolase family 97 protein [Gimibacter soli]|uniref:Glycoside hydrolase family 97 protein n=1 Tax=Gimibacter soli TaxID=3024400 RepID=A0AAE9XLS5_9PROT|nr:glycoside hydrolase family 97 protein [Gimibacter soli]WCL52616.1 glycoside hydrolase family 97 protein [Gimibacter soli]